MLSSWLHVRLSLCIENWRERTHRQCRLPAGFAEHLCKPLRAAVRAEILKRWEPLALPASQVLKVKTVKSDLGVQQRLNPSHGEARTKAADHTVIGLETRSPEFRNCYILALENKQTNNNSNSKMIPNILHNRRWNSWQCRGISYDAVFLNIGATEDQTRFIFFKNTVSQSCRQLKSSVTTKTLN